MTVKEDLLVILNSHCQLALGGSLDTPVDLSPSSHEPEAEEEEWQGISGVDSHLDQESDLGSGV
jgi:hypothetical protein